MWRFWGTAVYDIPAELLLESAVVGLLPLVPFTRGGAGRRVIERAAREIEARAPTDQLVPLETLLAVFGARSLGPDAMRAIVRRLSMSTEILDTSPLYREWVDQGYQRGRLAGARESVLVAWRSRFGEADADVVANLEGRQDADDLFAIAGGVFGATDLTAARALLGLAAPEPRP